MSPLLAIGLALVGSGAFAYIVKRFFPEDATPLELMKEMREDRDSDRDEMAVLRGDMRLLTNYVYDLRQHIVEHKPPPPPSWPEGLKM